MSATEVRDRQNIFVDKWSKDINYLFDVNLKYKSCVAVLLENQKNYNADIFDCDVPPKEYLVNLGFRNKKQWDAYSIATVKLVYSNLICKDLVSLQPLSNPNGFVYCLKMIERSASEYQLVLDSNEVFSKSRKMKAYLSSHVDSEDLALNLANEIDREIITDLRSNAGTRSVLVMNDYCDLIREINRISNIIHRKTLISSKYWIVCNPEIAKSILDVCEFATYNEDEIYKAGTCSNGRFEVYADKFFPKNKVLVGLGGDSVFNSGYFYSPYIPLYPLSDGKVITKYCKNMFANGANFYGLINVSERKNV